MSSGRALIEGPKSARAHAAGRVTASGRSRRLLIAGAALLSCAPFISLLPTGAGRSRPPKRVDGEGRSCARAPPGSERARSGFHELAPEGHRGPGAWQRFGSHELPKRCERQELSAVPPLPCAGGVRPALRAEPSDAFGRKGAADLRGPQRERGVTRRPSRELLGLSCRGRERLSNPARALPARRRGDRTGDYDCTQRAVFDRRFRDRRDRAE